MQDSVKRWATKSASRGHSLFNGGATSRLPTNDVLELTLGDPGSPAEPGGRPNNGGTKLKNGVYNGKRTAWSRDFE